MTEPPVGPPVHGTPPAYTPPHRDGEAPYWYAGPPVAGAELQPYGAAAPPLPYAADVPALPYAADVSAIPYAGDVPPLPYAAPYPGGHVAGYPLVSPGGRLGAALLDSLLGLVTLGIGWLIWSAITWSDGQTPAKQLLGHVVVDAHTGERFDWGRMALREFCVKGLLGWVLNLVTCGVWSIVDGCMIFGEGQRTLHDRMVNSVVRHG